MARQQGGRPTAEGAMIFPYMAYMKENAKMGLLKDSAGSVSESLQKKDATAQRRGRRISHINANTSEDIIVGIDSF